MLMYYEELKEEFVEKFNSYLPKEYRGRIVFANVPKTNSFYEALIVRSETYVSPFIDFAFVYEYYEKTENLTGTMEHFAKIFVKGYEYEKNLETEPRLEDLKNIPVKARLINYYQNKEMLQGLVHREYLDMAIVYYLEADFIIENSIINISTSLAEKLGYTEEQLYEKAKVNALKEPLNFRNVKEILRELFKGSFSIPLILGEPPMYVVSNQTCSYGASEIAFDERLQEIAERLGENFVILPSSVNECIIVPESKAREMSEMSDMVFKVNQEEVGDSQRLSNQVYKYDKEKHQLTVETENPKNLVRNRFARETLIN